MTLTPERLATLHRAAVTVDRPWSAGEFASLLASPYCFAVGGARAFALGRLVADEVELLMLATDPTHQRQGLARAALAVYEDTASRRGATVSFLEVADDNSAAIALYESAGYETIAHRAAYYRRSNGKSVDARVMQRLLT